MNQNEADADAAIAAVQADVDQNESDADTAIASNTTSINNLISGDSAFTSINVDGGAIDATTIGATSASTGAFRH